jgi:hypothetical protein
MYDFLRLKILTFIQRLPDVIIPTLLFIQSHPQGSFMLTEEKTHKQLNK